MPSLNVTWMQYALTLRLINLRDVWTTDDVSELHRELLKLISPIPAGASAEGSNRDPGFSLQLRSEEFPEFAGDLGETFLTHALGVLKGDLTSEGTASYQLKFRGRPILRFKPPRSRFPDIGRASFEVYFFVYKKDFFLGLPINTRQAQERGREEGGVHVYVDRFRVPPYGDTGDDWLKLDEFRGRRLTEMPDELQKIAGKAARPMLLLPGNNQLFGRVSLSRVTNPKIRQTLNRERLIEDDPAFEQLRSFVRLGIDWMTVSYAREFAASRENQGGNRERNDPVSLLTKAKAAFSAASGDMAPEQRAQVLQTIELARQTVAEQQEELISELSMLRVLASTGTMIVVFQHQLLGTLAALRDAHTALSMFVAKLTAKDRIRFEEELVRLNRWVETTHHQAQLLGLLMARKSRSRRHRIAVRPVVQSLKRAFDSYAADYGIEVQNNVPEGLRTPPMFDAELSAVLVNLLTNAFKAVREQPVRRVSVEGKRADSSVSLRVQDTGSGLAREDPDEYFKPFVGDSEPDPILGEGTGLGLKIVKDFVDVYGGRARFVPALAPWRTAIEITLPES
jgi:signal transduction histidine kinase